MRGDKERERERERERESMSHVIADLDYHSMVLLECIFEVDDVY